MSSVISRFVDSDLYIVIELLHQNKEIDAINYIKNYKHYIRLWDDYHEILRAAINCNCMKFLKECHPNKINTCHSSKCIFHIITETEIKDDMLFYLIDNNYYGDINDDIYTLYYCNQSLYELIVKRYNLFNHNYLTPFIESNPENKYITPYMIKECMIGIISIIISFILIS